MKKFLVVLSALLTSSIVHANICGTDYQTFNPTTNGLDFVTVQSSETIKPCYINMGAFVNYAANSLSYSRTVNSSYQSGQQRSDRITGLDLSVGTGITDRWDFGVNVPFVLTQHVADDSYVSSLEKVGATEFKANTKYRLIGNEKGGVAGIFSFNKNLISNNPFAGEDPGLTLNFEVAADTVIAKKWATAVNFGYRKRSPGETIPNLPYVPMKDQWIYSIAGSYLVASLDTKIIAEVYGAHAAQEVDPGVDRPMNVLEGLIGIKHDYNGNIAMHLGYTHRLDQALGGAEWRVYAGLNWAIGPLCKTPLIEKVAVSAPTDASALPEPEILNIDVQLLFKTDSNVIQTDYLDELDETLRTELTKPFRKLMVEGHTDSVGSAEYNYHLSQRRAAYIAKYLTEKYKLDPKKVESVGHGDTQPIADNGNYQGRQKNRRVELKIWR